MSGFSFISGLSIFIDGAMDSNATEIECESSINHYIFYQFSLIPAFVLTLLMAVTKSRRQKLLSFLDGRPGLIFPMDTLTRSSRISYSCAFGATGFLIYQILLDGKFAIDYSGPISLKTLIAVVSMFIYGMVFFPVFTSLALETAASYFLGSLYVWMFFVVEIYKITECNFNAAGRAILLLRALPSLLCLGYLSISMPIKFCMAICEKKYFTPSLGEDPYNETEEQIKESYQGKYVTKLFRTPEIVKPPQGILNIVWASVIQKLGIWIYYSQNDFRYPSRLISVMFVAGCVVYVITVELLVQVITISDSMLNNFESALDVSGGSDSEDDFETLSLKFAYYTTQVLRVSLIVSVSVSGAISFLSILHMLSSFRTNLFAMYRGDYSHIPSPAVKGAISLCTGSIKYAGFQVAYIVWAYVIICVILLIICIILAVVITLLMFGYTDWLVNKVLQIWPSVVIGIGLFVVQWFLAKFFFLQDMGQHLRLDNRRFYFVFVYFMFFYNIFLGLISCLLRIIKAIVVGTLFLARLDNSTLPRKFEFFDPGFSAYQGYIHMEAAHTHPVVNVFIRLLVAMSNSRKKLNSGDDKIEMSHLELPLDDDSYVKESDIDHPITRPVNVAARFEWYVTYTLLHNPMVRIYRKGFMQSMRKARREGLQIPISDMPITDIDLVKAQQERDRQWEEEAKKLHSPGHSLYDGTAAMTSMIGSSRNNEVEKTNQKEKRPKKHKWFRSWKKKTGGLSLTPLDNGSEEFALRNEDIGSYVTNPNFKC